MPHTRRTVNIYRRSVQVLLAFVLIASILAHPAAAQRNADVTFHFTVRGADGKLLAPSANAPVVLWLSPVGAEGQMNPSVKLGSGKSFQMVQKDKMFQPHLLVIPTGSLVSFPNRDPFFHNVFSLFNGRRFDLGLYETGATHSVPFNREGVSYIFCNIHPEMGAVIVSVSTPYFALATQASIEMHQVPPGAYLLKVWVEGATATSLEKASRRLKVDAGNTDAGLIEIRLQPQQAHTDKFGKPYSQHPEGSPY
ncbi:Plastocyanin [Granulicella pectinivorans]|uniref:Plastocyanin n=1 Tax=Granulicella pectinivorans TaxID=474950 RepID=A0A1I6M8M1_9BACT|nr:Plastocyanin [Granulicella pectinivorans]